MGLSGHLITLDPFEVFITKKRSIPPSTLYTHFRFIKTVQVSRAVKTLSDRQGDFNVLVLFGFRRPAFGAAL